MNQIISFSILLGGLFGVGTILQRGLRGATSPWVIALTCLIVCTDLGAALWLADHFSHSSYELIATTLAWCHFALVCFWCVCSRGPALLRIGLVGVVVTVLFLFFPESPLLLVQRSQDPEAVFLGERLRHRLVVTCVAAWIAGILCRLRGWRWEVAQGDVSDDTAHVQATAQRAWVSMFGAIAALGMVYALHWLVEVHWTSAFNRDFSIAALGCLYATLMLGMLSITACRFPNQWIGLVLIVMASGWALYKVENHWLDNFKSVSLRPGDWVQYVPWLLLGTSWWWLLWQHLSGVGSRLQQTDEPLLPRPKLKHLMLCMVLVCALFTSVKTRYFDRFDDLIRQDMRGVGGVVQPTQYGSFNTPPISGLIFGQQIPERVLNNVGRLTELRRMGFDGSTISPKIMDRLQMLSGLTELSFERCDMGMVQFSELKTLSHLESIRLIETPVELAEFQTISRLPNLRQVALSDASLLSGLRAMEFIETIDLSRSNNVDPQGILELNTKNVRSIEFPTSPKASGWKSVPDPARFPRLELLQVEVAQLTQSDVERIRQLPQLKRLDLIGCIGGLEHLTSISVEELNLTDCAVTPLSLAVLGSLEGPKSLTLQGHASQQQIQEGLTLLAGLNKRFESVSVDLRPDWNNRLPPGAVPSGVVLQIRVGYECHVSGLELQFENLLELLRLGHCEFIETRVRSGDKLLWPPDVTMSIHYGSLNLHKASAAEVSQIISASKQLDVLSLSNPQIHGEQWQMLTGLQTLVLQWNETPPDLRQVLDYFENGSDTRIILNLYGDDLTDDEEEELRPRLGGRLLINKIDRRPLP